VPIMMCENMCSFLPFLTNSRGCVALLRGRNIPARCPLPGNVDGGHGLVQAGEGSAGPVAGGRLRFGNPVLDAARVAATQRGYLKPA
jgi:hypothetical protein